MAGEGATPEELLLDAFVLPLRKPITFASITYTELNLKEPTAQQWTCWDKLDGVEADIMAVATIAAVPKQVVEQLGSRDLLIAARYIVRFLR